MWRKKKQRVEARVCSLSSRDVQLLNILGQQEKDRYTLLLTDIWLKLDEMESALKQHNDASDSGNNGCDSANDGQSQ